MSLSLDKSAYYASAFSTASTIASTYSNVSAIKEQGKTDRANIVYAKNDYIRRSEISFQQQEAIDREMGSMMSQRGLEALKAEARTRASIASTGVSGSTMDEIASQAGYDQLLDNEVIIAKARSSKLDTERTRLADYMNFKANTNKTPVYGSGANAIIAGLQGGIGILGMTQQLSGQSVSNMFSSNTNILSGYKSVLER